MATVFVTFANHFDLLWRRCWDRHYSYLGKRYISYRKLQNMLIEKNITLAKEGRGSYEVEQTLSIRAALHEHPTLAEDMQALYKQGLFEILAGGEAIIDQNQCHFETLIRNLASGVYFAGTKLKMRPTIATIRDAFGSSAQYPQIVRGCGLRGVLHPSYSYPNNLFWRGIDGSCIFVLRELPGTVQFFDHCYYEPCRTCNGLDQPCGTCGGTRVDLPQGFYPEFPRIEAKLDTLQQYLVLSEEMFPPTDFAPQMARWNQTGDQCYQFGTTRKLASLWQDLLRQTDNPPTDKISTKIENNPVQSGCLVSRSRVKLGTRFCEQAFYAWETATACTQCAKVSAEQWEALFLELPLYLFHDAVTGTHQDEASLELLERMDEFRLQLKKVSVSTVGNPATVADESIQVFQPSLHADPLRAPLELMNWNGTPLVAVNDEGKTFPIVFDHHTFGPTLPVTPTAIIPAVGPEARTRPQLTQAIIETDGLAPMVWSKLNLRPAAKPTAMAGQVIENDTIRITVSSTGIREIIHKKNGSRMTPGEFDIGELVLERDEGDPWNTRTNDRDRHALKDYTRYLGALRFEGYTEAYFGGRLTPNQRFGRESDPAVFGLDWYITMRLLDHSDRIDLTYEIFWNSSNRRIRVVFPTATKTDTATYGIPGGYLKRERYEPETYDMFSGKGDWPALHFVATEPDARGQRWAVVNYGTPSARVEDGKILISLLRSPAHAHCLERYAQNYPMPTSQMRDPGWHLIRLSILPCGQMDSALIARRAAALNAIGPAIRFDGQQSSRIPLISCQSGCIELVSAKQPFSGNPNMRIVRLLNLSSSAETASFAFAPHVENAAMVNLIEQEHQQLALEHGTTHIHFKPFEIRTLELTLKPNRT